jgi:membrane protease YdiL (CAAX protease family)
MKPVDWSAIVKFYVMACLGAVACGLLINLLAPYGLGIFGAGLAMVTPGAAAIVLTRWQGKPLPETLALRIGNWRWSLAALFAPVGLVSVMVAIGYVSPGATWDPSNDGILSRFGAAFTPDQLTLARVQLENLPIHPAFLAFLIAPIAGATINGLLALGEELGWRGWLYDALLPLGFWRANLLGGAMWGLWHAPMILQGHNWPDHPYIGALMMIAACALFAPILGFFRERSDSVLAAAFFHGTFNAIAAVLMLVFDGSSLWVHPLGGLGIAAMILVNGIIALARR